MNITTARQPPLAPHVLSFDRIRERSRFAKDECQQLQRPHCVSQYMTFDQSDFRRCTPQARQGTQGLVDMHARVWTPAEGAPAIRCPPKSCLLITSGQLGQSGIPEVTMPDEFMPDQFMNSRAYQTVQVLSFLELLAKSCELESPSVHELAGTSKGLASCQSLAYRER